jgi:hypothetical protein
MNLLILFLIAAVASIPLEAYIDFKLYKNKKTKKFVETVKILKTDREIYLEYLWHCCFETALFLGGVMFGIALAVSLTW